jgi:peptidoglycan-N-acetylglucosamine deacetylase
MISVKTQKTIAHYLHQCFLLLLLMLLKIETIAQDSIAYPWPEGKLAAISLSFDDARESQVIVGTTLLDQYGIKATFFVVPSTMQRQL